MRRHIFGYACPIVTRSLFVLLGSTLTLAGCSDDASNGNDSTTTTSSTDSGTTTSSSVSSGGAGGSSTTTAATTATTTASSTSQGGTTTTATVTASTGGTGGEFVVPTLLSETGLYEADMTTLAEGVLPFEPKYALWSDTAAKQRWVKLPPGSQIDTSEMDYWVYPIGTKLFKEFVRDGVRVETRLLQKIDEDEWFLSAFQWNEEQTDAEARPDGVFDASGTEHDIPSKNQCINCHDKMPDIALGFSALQLSHDGEGVTLQQLIDDGRLSEPPTAPFSIPGTETERAALGYLHANCGNCHQPRSFVSNMVDMYLWLPTGDLTDVANTPSVLTTVDRSATQPYLDESDGSAGAASFDKRIVAGDPESSIVYLRMATRETGQAMPPVGTELIDDDGSEAVRQWIADMQGP